MMSRRLWKTEKSSIVRRTESVSMIRHGQSVSGSEFHSSGPDTLIRRLESIYKPNVIDLY